MARECYCSSMHVSPRRRRSRVGELGKTNDTKKRVIILKTLVRVLKRVSQFSETLKLSL